MLGHGLPLLSSGHYDSHLLMYMYNDVTMIVTSLDMVQNSAGLVVGRTSQPGWSEVPGM